MNFALMNEIMAAHEATDTERVDALLTQFLRDIDLNALPDDLIERYMELLDKHASPVSPEAIARMHARFEEAGPPDAGATSGHPCLYDCLQKSLDDADDIGELGLDAESLEAIKRDRRPLVTVPETFRDFGAWLSQAGVTLPETLAQRLLKRTRRGHMELATRPAEAVISLQAARKESRRP